MSNNDNASHDPHGFLLINKPQGVTSFRLLGPLKKMFKPAKVGHAGTLDQEARGLMIVAIGKASRLLQFAEGASKTYEFTLHVGRETASAEYYHEDVLQEDLTQSFTLSQLKEVVPKFIGKIQQTPPQYSAVKIDGKRASDRVRAGEKVELKSREVEIHSLELVDAEESLNTDNTTPQMSSVRLRCHCSKGTYIRSLCADIAKELGMWGSASDIYRTQIGQWGIDRSFDHSEFQFDEGSFESVQEASKKKLIPAQQFFDQWTTITIPSRTAHFLRQGMKQDLQRINEAEFAKFESGEVKFTPGIFCVNNSGELVCFAHYNSGDLAPKVVFS